MNVHRKRASKSLLTSKDSRKMGSYTDMTFLKSEVRYMICGHFLYDVFVVGLVNFLFFLMVLKSEPRTF